MTKSIETHQLRFGYKNSAQPLFQDLNISIEEGSLTALLGSNGSGKSTLLQHFNALIMPKNGTVMIQGKWNTRDPTTWLNIRQWIGYVFQNPENQIISTLVEEDVAFALENLGVPQAEIRSRVDDALKRVGMYEYRLHPSYQLSGGQKQRVAIAGVLAMHARCILFDEATSMLDPYGRKEVLQIIKTLNKEYGVTVLMTTHLLEEVVEVGRVVVLHQGCILFDAAPEQVFTQVETLEGIGLTVPLMAKLADALARQGMELAQQGTALLSQDEFVQALLRYLKRIDKPAPEASPLSS